MEFPRSGRLLRRLEAGEEGEVRPWRGQWSRQALEPTIMVWLHWSAWYGVVNSSTVCYLFTVDI